MINNLAVYAAAILLCSAGAAIAADSREAKSTEAKPYYYKESDPEYRPPSYYQGKYYPNEYQGSFGYYETENSAKKEPEPQGYYNYYY